jgi:hypothetical protein
MTITEQEIAEIHRICQPLIGQRVQSVERKYFSTVELCFGKIIETSEEIYRSEWNLEAYFCAWRLQTADKVIASSNDPHSLIDEAIKQLADKAVRTIQVTRPALEAVLTFSGDFTLRLFPAMTNHYTHWGLFTDDQHFLAIGPGTGWSYEAWEVPEADDSAEDS